MTIIEALGGLLVLAIAVVITLVGVFSLYWTVKYGNAEFFDESCGSVKKSDLP